MQSKAVLPDDFISSWNSKLGFQDSLFGHSHCDHSLAKCDHSMNSHQQHSALKSNGMLSSGCLGTDVAIKPASGNSGMANGEWVSPCAMRLSPVGAPQNSPARQSSHFRSDPRNYRSLDRRAADRKLAKKMSDSCGSKIDCFERSLSDE